MKAIYPLVLALILLTAGSAVAQSKLKIDPESRYLLLSTVKTSTMQKELDEASAQGFRIISAASSCNQSEMVLFLERVTQGPDTYKYKLLATTRTSTMEKELNQAAKEGFRLLPRTITAKEGFLTNEIVSVLEWHLNQVSVTNTSCLLQVEPRHYRKKLHSLKLMDLCSSDWLVEVRIW